MNGAKVAMVVGILMLLVGFGAGVEPTSSSANPPGFTCRSVIPASLLTSDGTRADPPPTTRSGQDRRADENCHGVVRTATWLTWGGLGIGGLVLLVGWTAVREQGRVPQLSGAAS